MDINWDGIAKVAAGALGGAGAIWAGATKGLFDFRKSSIDVKKGELDIAETNIRLKDDQRKMAEEQRDFYKLAFDRVTAELKTEKELRQLDEHDCQEEIRVLKDRCEKLEESVAKLLLKL